MVGTSGSKDVTSWVNVSFFSPRFYKLHERKCEPVVMTVPRKVSPVLHFS